LWLRIFSKARSIGIPSASLEHRNRLQNTERTGRSPNYDNVDRLHWNLDKVGFSQSFLDKILQHDAAATNRKDRD
jgi:hypothetical protein